MNQDRSRDEGGALIPWDPKRFVRKFDSSEVKFSRGFLRSRPEKWFPAFATQWLPLAHSLGVEIRLVEVKPVLVMPKGLEAGFAGRVDDEPIGMFLDSESTKVVLDALCPGAVPHARDIVLEYLARRFLSSLALSWSGPESSTVQFDQEMNPFDVPETGTVKLTALVNNNHCTVWIALGRRLVERLDGLWRRQVHSSSKLNEKEMSLHIEVAQLAVPPSMLVDYMKSGATIDLEVLLTDTVTLKLGNRPWLPARLCDVSGKLGFEIISGPISTPALPDGTTRLSIEFPKLTLDSLTVSEIGQVGAIWECPTALENRVDMVINGERVAGATLCTYEGRFAVSVD